MAANPYNPDDVRRLTELCALLSGISTLDPDRLCLSNIASESGEDLDVFLPEAALFILLGHSRKFDELGIIVVLRIRERTILDTDKLEYYLGNAVLFKNSFMLQELLLPKYKLHTKLDEWLEMYLCNEYTPECVALLIGAGANVNCMCRDGHTAIHVAVYSGYVEYVRMLLEHGADPNTVTDGGETIFDTARGRNVEITHVLLDYNADVNLTNACGRTTLHHEHIDPSIMKRIAERVTNINAQEHWTNKTPLQFAVQSGCVENVRILLDNGANPNTVDIHGRSMLQHSSRKSNTDITELLLERGANVNYDGNRTTALHNAVVLGKEPMVALLLKYGANTDIRNYNGYTPLMIALPDPLGIVQLLLQHGASIHKKHDGGTSLLHMAAITSPACTKLLLEHGANIDELDDNGEPPLAHAVLEKSGACLQLLVEAGANINLVFQNGNTVLHTVIREVYARLFTTHDTSSVAHIDLLLNAHADCTIKNKYGETAVQLAQRLQQPDIIELFRKHGKIPLEKSTETETADTRTKKRKIEINSP